MKMGAIILAGMLLFGANLFARTGVDATGTNVVLYGPLEIGTNPVTWNGETKTEWPTGGGTTNASEINAQFTPTNSTPSDASVQGNLLGIDAKLGLLRFTDNGDGTITDLATGLMWIKNANLGGLMTWTSAVVYCENLVTNGYDDWRLPSITQKSYGELGGIAELDTIGRSGGNPAGQWLGLANTPFINIWAYIWSSEECDPPYGDSVYRLSTGDGSIAWGINKEAVAQALPVRGPVTVSFGTNAFQSYRGDWGAAASSVANAALPASSTNSLAVTALQITGGNPTNGAVRVATDTAGNGKWSEPVFVSAYPKLLNISNTTAQLYFTNVIFQVGNYYNATASTFTPPVGIYAITCTIAPEIYGAGNYYLEIYQNATALSTIKAIAPQSALTDTRIIRETTGTNVYRIYIEISQNPNLGLIFQPNNYNSLNIWKIGDL